MTSRYSASIGVAAGDRASAVLAAVKADARFYPGGGGTATRVSAEKGAAASGGARAEVVRVDIDAGQLPHLRAGINSALRLVQAAYESIGAASAPAARPDAQASAPGGPSAAPPAGAARAHLGL